MGRPWIVTPHASIEKLDANLWAVEGEVPGYARGRRRMVIARRANGTLVFFNAIPLTDDALAELTAWGKPGWLVLATSSHMIDARAFRERLGVKLLCSERAERRARKVVPVDGRVEELPPDPSVRVVALAGNKRGEVALVVRGSAGASVAFGDAFMNITPETGLLMVVLGFTGAPKCPPFFRFAFVDDALAFARDLAALAAEPGLARLIPSHGAIIERDAAAVLRGVISRDLTPR